MPVTCRALQVLGDRSGQTEVSSHGELFSEGDDKKQTKIQSNVREGDGDKGKRGEESWGGAVSDPDGCAFAKPKVSTVFGSYAPVILKDTCQYMNIHLIIDYTSSLLCCCMTWLITKYTQNIEIPKG